MVQLNTQLEQLAAAALEAHGLCLVAVQVHTGAQRLTVQVLAEQPSGASPTLTQCTKASRTLSAQLDVADVISRRYTLEVSSPGLERPLTTTADFQRFLGRGVKLSFTTPQPNEKGTPVGALHGILKAADDTTVQLGEKTYPRSVLKSAQLAATPEELAQLMKGAFLPGDVPPAPEPQDSVN